MVFKKKNPLPYRDANPVPTNPLADDISTAPSGTVALQVKTITLNEEVRHVIWAVRDVTLH